MHLEVLYNCEATNLASPTVGIDEALSQQGFHRPQQASSKFPWQRGYPWCGEESKAGTCAANSGSSSTSPGFQHTKLNGLTSIMW